MKNFLEESTKRLLNYAGCYIRDSLLNYFRNTSTIVVHLGVILSIASIAHKIAF